MMGPSGAGKTALLDVLTLDGSWGEATGSVTLNGVPLDANVFKDHCFVLKQVDRHWPYLTARETLTFATKLFNVADASDVDIVVNGVLEVLGLEICADTHCARLSGGQKRRLSLAVALLKQPTLLFLDEPTTGLDSASSSAITEEINRVAKDEGAIIICTIHQPSTKVYMGFDQVMILSLGRQAYTGPVSKADDYFGSIGHPLPPATNPAEHFLDLVNADFSDEDQVNGILDSWDKKQAENQSEGGKNARDGLDETGEGQPFLSEFTLMFRRCALLVMRDPVLYLGRMALFSFACFFFSIVYFKSRDNDQNQAPYKLWLSTWVIGMPANMAAVAVYGLTEEFGSISLEVKNGMVNPITYLISKSMLVIPVMFLMSIFSCTLSLFVMMDFPWEVYGELILLWAVTYYIYENVAEVMSVVFDDVVMGMLNHVQYWFVTFLFGGFLIPERDLYWPFKLFYYVTPMSYFLKSCMYLVITNTSWEKCPPEKVLESSVCVDSSDGHDVLAGLVQVFPFLSTEDTYATDILVLIAQGVFWKGVYTAFFMLKSKKFARIKND
jgi:ABC-type multidrug transport system ATPase subunit